MTVLDTNASITGLDLSLFLYISLMSLLVMIIVVSR